MNERSDKPKVIYDLEFLFHNGAREFFSALDGRDHIAADEARVKLLLYPDPQTVEEIIISRPQVALMRTIKRTLLPEVTTEDAGRIRLVGDLGREELLG